MGRRRNCRHARRSDSGGGDVVHRRHDDVDELVADHDRLDRRLPPPAIAFAVAGHLATNTIGAICVFSALMLMSAAMWWFDRNDRGVVEEGTERPSHT
jgi:hypothetical protein